MTTTPLSMDESLNGSWVDVNSPSQIHSPPLDSNSTKYQRPPYSLAESVQHLGVISFQVEKMLQEAELENRSRSGGSQKSGISGDDMMINTKSNQTPPSSPKSQADIDYLSDSISLVEAIFDEQEERDTDWLWDWTSKPEYFSKEWKMQQPLKRSKLSLRQWAVSKGILSREVMSLLFLTNILSIIIGAGISYSILVKRPSL